MTGQTKSAIRQRIAILVLTLAIIWATTLVLYEVSHLWLVMLIGLVIASAVQGKNSGRAKGRATKVRIPHVPHPLSINWIHR